MIYYLHSKLIQQSSEGYKMTKLKKILSKLKEFNHKRQEKRALKKDPYKNPDNWGCS